MLSHGFECHLYANDFHIFISSLTTLLNSGFRAPSVFPNIFIGCLIKQLRLQKSKTELWLSTPATASAPFPVSLSGNSCPPGAQPKTLESPLTRLLNFMLHSLHKHILQTLPSHYIQNSATFTTFSILSPWSEQLSFSWIIVITS